MMSFNANDGGPKMEGITTLGIEKLFGVKRNRLKEWVFDGHISPSLHLGTGHGSKSIFSREDVYRILLFARLMDLGFPTSRAAINSRLRPDHIVQARTSKQPFCMALTFDSQNSGRMGWSYSDNPKQLLDWISHPGMEYSLIVNLSTIIRKVDEKFAG